MNWPELIRVLSLHAARENTTVLVKSHPRPSRQSRLVHRDGEWLIELVENALRALPGDIQNSSPDAGWLAAEAEVDSSSLIEWADVVLSLGTSVTSEAVAFYPKDERRNFIRRFIKSTTDDCVLDLHVNALDEAVQQIHLDPNKI